MFRYCLIFVGYILCLFALDFSGMVVYTWDFVFLIDLFSWMLGLFSLWF